MPSSYTWVDDDTIIAAVIPEGRGPPLPKPLAPIGPRIEDNVTGKKSQARTYQDLLKTTYDEELFEYYATSSLVSMKVRILLYCFLRGGDPSRYILLAAGLNSSLSGQAFTH